MFDNIQTIFFSKHKKTHIHRAVLSHEHTHTLTLMHTHVQARAGTHTHTHTKDILIEHKASNNNSYSNKQKTEKLT